MLAARKRILLFGLLLLLAGIAAVFLTAPEPQNKYMQTRTFPVMGTIGKITVSAENPETVEKALNLAQDTVRKIEGICNIFDPESELSRLNRDASEREVVCSPLLWELLNEAERFYRLSGGAFDATVRPLMKLWGFHRKRSSLPSETEIEQIRKIVGWDKVLLNPERKSVFFRVKGVSIDLGGIAKGFALDKAAEKIRSSGQCSAVLNLGGNILCIAQKNQRSFHIGIRDPLSPDRIFETLEMRNQAIATSGNYERYVVIDGKHYTHIMDPRTGKPVQDMLSVTVRTLRGVDSDALSTVLFVKGTDFAPEICRIFPDTGVIAVRRSTENPSGTKISRYGTLAQKK